MKYQIKDEGEAGYSIEIENKPAFFHVLNQEHLKDESALQQGTWLVMLMYPWSPQTHTNLKNMMRAANELAGRIEFGMRVFGDSEIVNWCPEANLGHQDPLTLVLQNGRILWSAVGVVAPAQVLKVVREHVDECIN